MGDIILRDNTLYEVISPILTSNTSAEKDGFVLSTTVKDYGNKDKLYYIMDGDESTSWVSYPYYTSGNFMFNFNKFVQVDAVFISFVSSGNAWKSWTLEGYNGEEWILIHKQTTSIASIFINCNANYSKYRISQVTKPSSAQVRVKEVTFYRCSRQYKIMRKLNENIPENTDDGYDRFIFDENGKLFISKLDGTFIQSLNDNSYISEDITNNNGIYIPEYKNRELLNSIYEDNEKPIYKGSIFAKDIESKKENNGLKKTDTNEYEVIVDKELDPESENPVSNDAIAKLINEIWEGI